MGNENAFRAVANANGKNLISVVVPCHRVISYNWKIGGYSGGIDRKKLPKNDY
ncbi:methylated-DNA--[protein]-cysteine S-methyltransferase [Mesoplasma melaleucae]|uniref:methylated-DNA--[protein]-cysteine S-methyltransferase n=1 Tax=Mesoplasma melaleucae TaxID=81459 RepID=UPI003A5C87C9